MLEKFIPMDTLLSYSRQIIFKIENILFETDIPVAEFSDFVNTMLDDDYNGDQTDNSLIKLLYWYILDKVAVQTEEYLGETDTFFISGNLLRFLHPLEEHIEIEEVNGMVNYICERKNLLFVKERLDILPPERQSKIIKWFINEFERCTNLVL
jgi:hypothetical protein